MHKALLTVNFGLGRFHPSLFFSEITVALGKAVARDWASLAISTTTNPSSNISSQRKDRKVAVMGGSANNIDI